MKIYIIRHGQTTGDVEDRYGGAYDDELTSKGKFQVQKLADKISKSRIQILFSSPMKRAKQTSEILLSTLNCEVKIIEDLKERNKNGILSGMTKGEAKIEYPKLVNKLNDFRNQIKGAESQDDFEKRLLNAFFEIADNKNYSTIGIVTHGGPFWVIFREILRDRRALKIADCAFIVLEKKGDKFALESSNGIEYKEVKKHSTTQARKL